MFHKLLGEASDDLDRVTLQSREDLRAESTRNTPRCSRAETASEVFSFSFRDNQSFAWTAGASCRWRFSQATRVVCASVQIWRVEVRVQDVSANFDDI